IARAMVAEHRADLGVAAMSGELRIAQEFETQGGWHLRYEQVVEGVPVFGSEVAAHVTKDGRPLLLAADVFQVGAVATKPAVTAEQAEAAARDWLADEDSTPAAVQVNPPTLA